MSVAFVFPGQGSQAIGMMCDLKNRYEVSREVFELGSKVMGMDLEKLIAEGPKESLDKTEITQPAVLVASLAAWRAWEHQGGLLPDYVAGHSLGEYTAMAAAGVISVEDAIALVALRGRLMSEAVPDGEGGMAAILGLDDEQVVEVCAHAAQGEVVEAVNFNAPGQVVIAGASAALERAIDSAKKAGARRALKIPVSVPCHSALMKPAAEELAAAMDKVEFKTPRMPVIQNVVGRAAANVEELKKNLIEQLYSPVLWTQSVQELSRLGVDQLVECGPGKVLSGLNKRIIKGIGCLNILDLASLDEAYNSFSSR